MNKNIEFIKNWILKRTKRQKIILFLFSLLVIYYIFHLILTGPVIAKQKILQQQISELNSQKEMIQQQLEMIEKVVNSPEFKNLIKQQKQLQIQGKNFKQTITSYFPVFVAQHDFSKLTKDILKQVDKTITLVSLKEFPDELWNAPEIDRSVINISNITQHKIAIAFRANYFDAMAYIARLEKLPWHLYWDQLEYKVTQYPEAEITLQLYVLSNKVST
jgi:MSHA biogenesis protein MshJ